MYLSLGVIGFIFFILFDLNKIYWKCRLLNLFFIAGSIFLAFSTGYSIWHSDYSVLFSHFGLKHLILLICLILSGALLIYALFFALPFDATYVDSNNLPLVNTGLYGVCRHPGFWMLSLFYLFLTLLFDSRPLFYCFIVYTICNYLYIIIQDLFIFPKYIQGYEQYKKTVPFLIPNKKSIRNLRNRIS